MTETRLPTVFVVMPFAGEMRANYDLILRPAIVEGGAQPVRADEEHAGHIHGQMMERLFDADVVLVDISGSNPNVFYELGVAHGSRGRTLMVVREDFTKAIPFDVMPYRVFVFPDPRTAEPARVADAIKRLAAEVRQLCADPAGTIPNPVQDFLAVRSALRAPRTVFLPEFTAQEEEETAKTARESIDYVGLTGASMVPHLVASLEQRPRKQPLRLRFGLLASDCLDGWRFLFNLREGRSGSEGEVAEMCEEDGHTQAIQIKRLRKVALANSEIHLEIIPIQQPLHFWACALDRERIIVGHYAMKVQISRGFPVTVLVASDPHTRALYDYYAATLEQLLSHGSTSK